MANVRNSELHCHTQFSDMPGLFIKAACMKIFILISVGLISGVGNFVRRGFNKFS
jgi:hypothetical protein